VPPPTRLSREQKKAQTRAAIVQSAAEVFARRGFHAASVDEIAENAGYSVGALYSNFERKEDLLLATVEHTITGYTRLFDERFSQGQSFEDQASLVADAWMAAVTADPGPFLLWVELWANAIRGGSPLRDELASRTRPIRDLFTKLIVDAAGRADVSLSDEIAEELGSVFDALGLGFAVRRLLDPEAVPDGLFGTASSRIVHGLLSTLPSRSQSDEAGQPG
jgi:AcrR family transcriptional regulator